MHSAQYGCEAHCDVRSPRAEHYILEGVTDALFLCIRTTTIELRTRTKNIADVIPRGVYIRLRSVLRGLLPLAHFTDIYMLQRWCLLCLFSSRLW